MGSHGQGTIVPLPNGRYRIAVTMADGRRVWRRARSAKEAERERRRGCSGRGCGVCVMRGTSGSEARQPRAEPFSERHVQAWLDADGAAPRTVHHHRAVLRRALNVALRQRIVSRNVALAVDLPGADGFTGSPLSLVEARELLEATAPDRLHTLWRLALDTGARQGELLGLGWDDFDPEAGTVRIHSQLQRRDGKWVRTPTKAARDAEAMTLMPETVAALQAHRVRQAAEREPVWKYWGHIFLAPDGDPLHGADVLRAFKAACVSAGIAPRRFHDLRASTATILRELGVAEDVRMARLGHATERMARHYAKARTGYDREAVAAFSRALAG